MTDNPDARVNLGGSWAGYDSRNLRPAQTDLDLTTQVYRTLGFRTYRHFRQSLDQQQPRS